MKELAHVHPKEQPPLNRLTKPSSTAPYILSSQRGRSTPGAVPEVRVPARYC